MATFCSNCGHQLESNERFCAQCGHQISASPSVASIPRPQPQPVQQMATVPAQYPSPGPVPLAVALPQPPVPARRGGMLGVTLLIAAIAGGAWYYLHNPPPGKNKPGNAALVQQQSFEAHWENQNGFLVLTTAKWTNGSNVNMTSAVVQCEQDSATGIDLAQYRVTLNGPTSGNTYSSYSNIQIGAVAPAMSKVNCNIVRVKPSN